MDTHALTFSNQKLVADFCDSEFAPKSRGFLVPYAAHVVLIARMSRSTRLTAAFLSEKFGRKFSRRPVEDILAKVKMGDIVVTADQLAEVAAEHPAAQHFASLYPDILNPTSRIEIEDAPAPAKKTAARKNSKDAATKKTPAKPSETTAPKLEKSHMKETQPAVQSPQAGGTPAPTRTMHLSQEDLDKATKLLDEADQEDEEFYS